MSTQESASRVTVFLNKQTGPRISPLATPTLAEHPIFRAEARTLMRLLTRSTLLPLAAISLGIITTGFSSGSGTLPNEIRAIMEKPRYANATWALRVVDPKSGDVVYDLNSDQRLLTGSVRKLYSVGTALNKLGPDDRFKTPVFRSGEVDVSGNLRGDLILVAKGDLTMGGRDCGHDCVAYTDFDHNDANSLGSAILTTPDPLAGLNKLAAQVAAAGIKTVSGDVIIDDRLFPQFRVPNQKLLITPIVINDNRIDVTILPTTPGSPADVEWRPQTKAFEVENKVTTVDAGEESKVTLTQENGHQGVVSGTIAVDYVPPLPGVKKLVQTFRTDPEDAPPDNAASFARTTFIEALERAGITVKAKLVAPNPAHKLPSPDAYSIDCKVAELVSAPYSQYAKLILKVSLNLGANLSLMLFGLANGVDTVQPALAVERTTLIQQYGLDGNGFNFPTNGSGSPDSEASAATTANLLTDMTHRKTFPFYFQALPIFGVDGSLATVGVDSPARGKIFAKTGTYISPQGEIAAQTLAGYMDARSGRKLVYSLFVNNAGTFTGIDAILDVIDDEADISTIIQQSN
jgi:D-alanyl-D-alanine carboxypeptidase